MASFRTERLALAFLAAASPALLAASLLPGPSAAWAFALLGAAFPVALMALGAFRPGPGPGRRPARWGATGWLLVALLLVLEATAAGILLLAGIPAGASGATASPGAGGLPLATVIQVVGLWLLPLPLATLGYALTFDRTGVTEEDLARLRARAAGGAAEGGTEGG